MAQVEGVVDDLETDRVPAESIVILTSNYGEADALQLLGNGNTPVVSGHNAYWFWGPVPDRPVVVAVGNTATELLEPICQDLTVVAEIDNPESITNQEFGQPIAVCSRLTETLPQAWPRFRYLA